MDLKKHFQRLLEYDVWANREVHASLKSLGEPPSNIVKLLAHVISAEHVWLSRMKATPPPFAVWPELSLGQCEEQINALYLSFDEYFQSALPAALDHTVNYKNSKGEAWTSRVEDILTHVFMHSTHHRGQIALQMRQSGHVPAYTDFIHGVRQGLVK